MQNSELNIAFVSDSDIPAGSIKADSLLVLSDGAQAKRLGLPSTMQARIDRALSGDRVATFTAFVDRNVFIVVAPYRNLECLRLAGASAYKLLYKHGVNTVVLRGLAALKSSQRYALLEGMILNSYVFDRYKSKKDLYALTVQLPAKRFSESELKELTVLGKAIALTKDMVNEPPNYMNALQYGKEVEAMGQEFGFETEVLHKNEIEALGMGGLLAVNKGSVTPPTFNVMCYNPKDAVNKKPLVLVGKGVMFDTGGYSLKVGGNMISMKSDMAGGAAVLGIIAAIAGNKLPYYVIGLVPATDNKIAGDALVVDDIIQMMDGSTVEVQNTDAEGRLVLADALTYVKRFEPELVIDMATLTGASAAITGPYGIAVLGNDQERIDQLKAVGEQVYERLLQLPLWKEFRDLLKSNVADRSNLGGPIGGVSTSAIFLEHFTDYPWIHLDIAGAAFVKDAKGYRQKGATAVPVRLIYEFVKQCISLKKV